MSPYAALTYIKKGVGYEDFLKEYAEYRRMKPEELYDIFDELLETTKGIHTHKEWFAFIEEYTKKLTENREKENTDGVRILTMHGAKGLEFETVFIPGLNENSIPYRKAVMVQEIEEERRLLYVALTRAKKNLHLSYVIKRFDKEMQASRFLDEIYKKKSGGDCFKFCVNFKN
jgi:DNA helicase-2/ATP-dependent DNA helicase PcrA